MEVPDLVVQARELPSFDAVRVWVKQAEIDAGKRTDGLTTDDKEELSKLRRENRRLREDGEMLKRATAFM